MIYCVVFSLLAFLTLVAVGVKGKKQIFIEILAVVIVVLFQGLRWENGTDWDSYYGMFMYPSEPVYYNEYGWWLLNDIVRRFSGESYTAMLIVQSALIVFLNIRFAKYAGLNNITSIIFSCFVGSIFPVRFALASIIIILGFRHIVDRNFKKFFLYVIVASTIHIATLLIIPFYFVPRKRFSLAMMLFMYLASIMIGFASSSVVSFLDSINSLLAIGSFDGDIQEKIDGYMYGGIAEYSIRSVLSIILSFCSGAFFIWLYHYFGNHYFSKASSVQEEYRNNMYHTLLNLYIFGMYFNRTIAFAIPYLSRIGILASGGVAMLLLLGIEKKFRNKLQLRLVFIVYIIYRFILFNQILHGQYESLFIPYHSAI